MESVIGATKGCSAERVKAMWEPPMVECIRLIASAENEGAKRERESV